MKRCILLFGVLWLAVAACAQAAEPDTLFVCTAPTHTLAERSRYEKPMDRFTSSRGYQMTYIGVPLIVGGLIVKGQDDHFRNLRHSYAPSFRWHYDDYLQYSPAALMLGLKVCGVQGRSSWGRMLTSDAFSIAIMTIAVNSLKPAARVMRPDGSSRNSFPSGHTATAFMTATMLHKEYGWRSPWYSIAGYSVASATGLSRMLNNRHWLSDVMAGAGIGILATELGYFFADLIFKKRGLAEISIMETFDRTWRPSFLGFHMGFDVVPGTYHPFPATSLNFSTGSNIGVEGAWFFSSYVGVGARVSVGSMTFRLDGQSQLDPLKSAAGYTGAYFSYPVSARWMVGAKVLAGYYYYDECQTDVFRFGARGGFSTVAGCSMKFRAKQNMSVRFFFDYTVAPPIVRPSRERLHLMTFGTAINIVL